MQHACMLLGTTATCVRSSTHTSKHTTRTARRAAAARRRLVRRPPTQSAISSAPEGQRPAVFVSSSAVGYYGSSSTSSFTEESAAGSDYLAEICKGAWVLPVGAACRRCLLVAGSGCWSAGWCSRRVCCASRGRAKLAATCTLAPSCTCVWHTRCRRRLGGGCAGGAQQRARGHHTHGHRAGARRRCARAHDAHI
jgi:hypothetical protein